MHIHRIIVNADKRYIEKDRNDENSSRFSVGCHIENGQTGKKEVFCVNKDIEYCIFDECMEQGKALAHAVGTISYVLLSKNIIYLFFFMRCSLFRHFAIEFSCSCDNFLILLSFFLIFFRLFFESSSNFCTRYAFNRFYRLYELKRMENLIILSINIDVLKATKSELILVLP